LWRARQGLEQRDLASKAGEIKTKFPKEDIKWKHPAEMIICLDINIDKYIPVRFTREVLTEIYRVLKPNGILLFSLEKMPGSEIDKDFNYIHEDEYVKVKKHFHRVGVRKDLRLFNELFSVIKLGEDEDYYYVIALKG